MARALNLTLPIKQDPETLKKLEYIKSIFAKEIQPKIEEALRKSEIVHFARVLVIHDKYLQVITEYDGDPKEYTEFFRVALPDVFGALFSLAEGAPKFGDLDELSFFRLAQSLDLPGLGEVPARVQGFERPGQGLPVFRVPRHDRQAEPAEAEIAQAAICETRNRCAAVARAWVDFVMTRPLDRSNLQSIVFQSHPCAHSRHFLFRFNDKAGGRRFLAEWVPRVTHGGIAIDPNDPPGPIVNIAIGWSGLDAVGAFDGLGGVGAAAQAFPFDFTDQPDGISMRAYGESAPENWWNRRFKSQDIGLTLHAYCTSTDQLESASAEIRKSAKRNSLEELFPTGTGEAITGQALATATPGMRRPPLRLQRRLLAAASQLGRRPGFGPRSASERQGALSTRLFHHRRMGRSGPVVSQVGPMACPRAAWLVRGVRLDPPGCRELQSLPARERAEGGAARNVSSAGRGVSGREADGTMAGRHAARAVSGSPQGRPCR